MDSDGPFIARDFYTELFKDHPFDSSRAAYALHHATTELRKLDVSASRWVPFIHIGV